MITDKSYVKDNMPLRSEDANKYSVGTLLCVCGSVGMSGAAVLCAKAAYKCGAGLVRLAVPESIYPIVASQIPEAVFTLLPQTEEGSISKDATREILTLAHKSSAVLMGCGSKLTQDTISIVSSLLYECKKPLILDADGINALSKHIDVLKDRVYPTILTPHEGEMSRLTGLDVTEIRKDRRTVAQDLADEYDAVVVLKGKDTVIASKGAEPMVNPTGNSAMAKAGAGDVLAGMIASFVAQGVNVRDASVLGAYLHGLSGDLAAEKLTMYGVTASDIIDFIPEAIKSCIEE